jgi:PAS domain S-box-containing protein
MSPSSPKPGWLWLNPGQLSITSRLTLTFLGVGLVPLLTSQWMALEQFKRTLVLNHLEQTGQIAEAKRDDLESFLDGSRRALEQVAQSPTLREELERNQNPEQAARVLAEALRSAHGPGGAEGPFESLHLVDSQGRVVISSLDPTSHRDPAAAGLSRALRQQLSTATATWASPEGGLALLAQDPTTKRLVTDLAVPVRGADEKTVGLVTGTIDAGNFRRLMNTQLLGLGRTARTELVTLQDQGKTLTLTRLGLERGATTEPGKEASKKRALRFEPLTAGPLRTRNLDQAAAALDGGFRSSDGRERIGSWRRLSQGKIGLLVSMERSEVVESTATLRDRLLGLMVLATSLVGAAGVLLGRSLTRPLLDLHTAVRDFDISNDGQLRPVAVKGHDEIAELANTINSMVLGIQERSASLNRTNNRIQTYIQTVQTALLAIGNGGEITLLNEAGCRLLGFPPAGWLGRNWIADFVVDEEAQRQLSAALAKGLTSGPGSAGIDEAAMLEYRVRSQDGQVLLMRWHNCLLRGETGQVLGMLCSGEDITRSRSQELELIEARKVAEQANSAKSEFLSRMSHELRTPMNAIIGLSYLALRAEPEPRLEDYISKINSAGQKLLTIINDILDFSKIEAGRMTLERTDFLLDSVLTDLTGLTAHKIFNKGLELLFLVDEDVPRHLNGDPLRLGQVLLNLLSNSSKFTELGQIVLHIRYLERQNQRIKLGFEVSDTGIGISESQLANLFQPFEQAELSTARHYGGTGLGLTICRHLLGLMEGSIEASSEVGAGTTFRATAWFGLAVAPPSPVLPHGLNGLSVLLVDDNPIAISVLESNLAHLPIRLSTCGSGQETLERVEQAAASGQPIDLILLDWQLPDMDGLETVRRLKALEVPHTPEVVMVTAYGSAEIRMAAAALGVQGFLTKPICQSDLVDTLIELVEPTSSSGRSDQLMAETLLCQGLDGLRVLLVEDNQINQQICVELLSSVAVNVTVAENGEEALRLLDGAADNAGGDDGSLPFDLVLMDLNMPVLDGWEATRRLRRNPRFNDLPVLAMTAHALVEERERCLALGMQEHLTKPIEPTRLYAALAHWGQRTLEADTASAAAQPGIPPATTPPPPGLDREGGLRRTAGNEDLYHRLLSSMANTQADAADRVAAALNEQDAPTARRIAHTVKGVAANLGATALAEAASRLENTLQAGHPSADDLDHFRSTLEETVALIRALPSTGRTLAEGHGEGEELGGSGPDGPWDAAMPEPADLLEQLRTLLQAGDGEAIDLVQAHRASLQRLLGGATFRAMEGQLEHFAFEAAAAALEAATPVAPALASPGNGDSR